MFYDYSIIFKNYFQKFFTANPNDLSLEKFNVKKNIAMHSSSENIIGLLPGGRKPEFASTNNRPASPCRPKTLSKAIQGISSSPSKPYM